MSLYQLCFFVLLKHLSSSLFFSTQYYNRMSFENDSTPTVTRVCQSLKCMKKRVRFVRLWLIDQLKMCMQRWNPFLKTNNILGYSLHFSIAWLIIQWLLPSFILPSIQPKRVHASMFALQNALTCPNSFCCIDSTVYVTHPQPAFLDPNS